MYFGRGIIMKKIHLTPSIYRSDDTLTRNTIPNPNLKSPALSPGRIGVEEEDFIVLVTVPPYQNMRTGDRVYLNVGFSTSEPYEVSENDVGNSIIFLLKKEQLVGQDMRTGATISISYVVPTRSVEDYPAVSNISGDAGLKFYSNMTLGLTPPNLASSMTYTMEPPLSLAPHNSPVLLSYTDGLTERDILYLYAVVGDGEYVYQTQMNYDNSSVLPKNSYKCILIESKDLFPHAGKEMTLWYTINTGSDDRGNLYKSTIKNIAIPKEIIGRPAEILNGSIIPLATSTVGVATNLGNYSLSILIPPYIGRATGDTIILTITTNDLKTNSAYEMAITEENIENEIEIKVGSLTDIAAKFPKNSYNPYLYISYKVYKTNGTKISGEMNILRYV
jgi:hypothetical protein